MKEFFNAFVIFAAGVAIGVLFYPSKRVEEKERVIAELQEEKSKIEARVSELETRSKESIRIVERPDGTKETRIVRKRDVERKTETSSVATTEVAQKIESEKEKITETNLRRFIIELGARTDSSYYLRAAAEVAGPLTIGVECSSRGVLGAGVGLRF